MHLRRAAPQDQNEYYVLKPACHCCEEERESEDEMSDHHVLKCLFMLEGSLCRWNDWLHIDSAATKWKETHLIVIILLFLLFNLT